MKRFLMFFGLLMIIIAPLFAQVVDPPGDWLDLYENYGVFFATYLGIAGVAMFLSEFVIRLLKLTEKFQKTLAVFVLAVGASFIGNLINIGFLAEATWWETIFWGMLAGVAANGIWSSNLAFLKTMVEFLIGLIKAKSPD